ncbi:hypothetical protein DK412_28415 [Methylobacterium sp. 17Sr1-1]|nr:hypothetical protein DK412_28415 [Methylobacterium sp. 17Sr1-1]
MRLREKGKTDGEPVTMGWDEAQAALAAGTHEVAEGGGTDALLGLPEEQRGDANGSGDQGGDQGKQGGDNFDATTRPELETLASERGIDVSEAKTKADVIEALRAAR